MVKFKKVLLSLCIYDISQYYSLLLWSVVLYNDILGYYFCVSIFGFRRICVERLSVVSVSREDAVVPLIVTVSQSTNTIKMIALLNLNWLQNINGLLLGKEELKIQDRKW